MHYLTVPEKKQKFNLRIVAARKKSGRPKQTLTEEQVEWLVRHNLCNSQNGQYLIIAKTNELKLCCFCLLISRLYVANTLGPSIKYVRCLRGRDVVKAKAYIYCFYEVILLFKSVKRGGVPENHQIRAYVLYGWSLLLYLIS